MSFLLPFFSCDKESSNLETTQKKELKIGKDQKREFTFEMDVSAGLNEVNIVETEVNRFVYKSGELNGIISSTLRIVSGNTTIYSTSYQINTTLTNYRLLQSNLVKQKAELLNYNFDSSGYALLAGQLNYFIETMMEGDSIYAVDVHAVFFHQAIMNTKLRGIVTNLYECVPHPGYILGRSFFSCMEDFIVPKSIIMGVFNSHPELLTDATYINLYNYVNTSNSQNFSYDKIYYFQVSKAAYLQTLDNIINQSSTLGNCSWWCPIGCGSAWGCCGNYSGCCLYWNFNCWTHDALCTNCLPPRYCLSGCIPDR